MFEFLKKKFGKKADASPSSPEKPEAKEPEKMAEPFFPDPYDFYGSYEDMDMQEGCPSQPTVENSKELGRELKKNAPVIDIEGEELIDRIEKIKTLNKALIGLCLGFVSIIITGIVTAPATAGTSAVASTVAFTSLAGVSGGASVASSLVGIALAGGGITAIRSLDKYRFVKFGKHRARLYRKGVL